MTNNDKCLPATAVAAASNSSTSTTTTKTRSQNNGTKKDTSSAQTNSNFERNKPDQQQQQQQDQQQQEDQQPTKTKMTITVAVGSTNPCKIGAVQLALERVLEGSSHLEIDLDIQGFDVESGVDHQPMGDVSTSNLPSFFLASPCDQEKFP